MKKNRIYVFEKGRLNLLNEKKEIDLNQLELVDGWSAKAISKTLTEQNIRHKLSKLEREDSNFYFKSSGIIILSSTSRLIDSIPYRKSLEEHIKLSDIITSVCGHPDHERSKVFYYHAYYRMKPDFDLESLNGKLTFHKGLLVEKTMIYL